LRGGQLIAAWLLLSCFGFGARADETADALLRALDKNMVFETRTAKVTMRITKGKRVIEKELLMRSRGYDTTYTEFLVPPRDAGTRYLKIDRNLWMWIPSAERVIKISGHMLRQSLMGSDFSYEDMLESPDMASRYEATIAGHEEVDGAACTILDLKATKESVTYPRRRVFIEDARKVPRKVELYAMTGKLIKEERFFDVESFETSSGERSYPTRLLMRNLLTKETQTEMVMKELRFGVDLPDEIFSLGRLRRGR